MTSLNKVTLLAAVLPVLMLAPAAAHAQFAVIDVASVTQLVEQAQTLSQQLTAAQQQLQQAQALYRSTTGNRGMEQLLGAVPRNYLPSDWAQLAAAARGGSGARGALAADVQAAVSANAVLSAQQMAVLPLDAQSQLDESRRSVALLQALAQEALVNSSSRFASIQQLIGAIPSASDQKGILDLQARIGAEQGMLQNEQTKLQVLYQAAQAQAAAVAQQTRERVIAGHGNFAARFQPAPL
jgi:type IV secretion system protein VirB5